MKEPSIFSRCLAESDRALSQMDLPKVFAEAFPGFRECRKATVWEDREGIDYFVRANSEEYGVDLKVLSRDPVVKGRRVPELPLELWSVKERSIRGYGGRADYVLWLYRDSDRRILVDRRLLATFIEERRFEWSVFLEEHSNSTRMDGGCIYTSSIVWLPYHVLDRYTFFRHWTQDN